MTNPPRWYWLASVLALLWSLVGCFAYWQQIGRGPEELAALPPAEAAVWAMMPKWVVSAYAIAVWGALAGSVGLLLRRHWARLLMLASLAGIIVQFGWSFLATPLLAQQGAAAAAFPLFIMIAGMAMLWLARHAEAQGWLR